MSTNFKQVLLILVCICAIIGATYWLTGIQKDNEYKNSSKHTSDTTVVIKYLPQPPRIITVRVPEYITKHDSIMVDSAYLAGVSLERFRFIASNVDTMITFDTVATLHVKYVPLQRLLTTDLQLAPIRMLERTIVDSLVIPIPTPDSFMTRVGIFTVGTAIGVVIMSLLK